MWMECVGVESACRIVIDGKSSFRTGVAYSPFVASVSLFSSEWKIRWKSSLLFGIPKRHASGAYKHDKKLAWDNWIFTVRMRRRRAREFTLCHTATMRCDATTHSNFNLICWRPLSPEIHSLLFVRTTYSIGNWEKREKHAQIVKIAVRQTRFGFHSVLGRRTRLSLINPA